VIVIREVWKSAQEKDANGEWIFGEEEYGDPLGFIDTDKETADREVAETIKHFKESGFIHVWDAGRYANQFVRIEMVTIPFAEWKEKYGVWDYGGFVGVMDWCKENDWYGDNEPT